MWSWYDRATGNTTALIGIDRKTAQILQSIQFIDAHILPPAEKKQKQNSLGYRICLAL